jgi:hypothetical protein
MKFFNAEIYLGYSNCTGYGRTPEEAFGALLSVWRDRWAPVSDEPADFLEENKEDILVYEPEVGTGYVVAGGDDLGRPIRMSGDNAAFADLMTAYLSGDVIPCKGEGEARPLFVAGINTRSTQSLGFGGTAEEAVQVLLARWRLDYAPEADADEGYLAEIREDMSIFEVDLGQGYIDNPENPALARPLSMRGDDPRLDAVFEEYTQVAKPWQR